MPNLGRVEDECLGGLIRVEGIGLRLIYAVGE